MFVNRKSLVLGLMAVLAPLASAASAQDNGLGYAYLFGYGVNNVGGLRPFVAAPPYFAMHPPVYYGQRYTRPYGESPFAAWPQLRSPANYVPRPAAPHVQPVIINFAPAHPQAGSAGHLEAAPAPTYSAPLHSAPLPTAPVVPQPAPPAPPAPAAPAVPSPVVIQAIPVQPLVIDNPYYRADQSRFVGKSSIGQ